MTTFVGAGPSLDRGDTAGSVAKALEAMIDRVRAVNPALNAIVAMDFEAALESASRTDALDATERERSPLSGIVLTIKESFRTRGFASTFGLMPESEKVALDDEPIVARAREHGAIVLGKTNVATRLWNWQTENVVYGRTNNPYNLSRTAGGSSGGGAAAVAAGMCDGDIGSDLIGSILIPAALCGVFGLRPSSNAESDSIWLSEKSPCRELLPVSVAGPMAATLPMLERLYRTLSQGANEGCSEQQVTDYRIAALETGGDDVSDPEVIACVERCYQLLRGRGTAVARIAPDMLPDMRCILSIALNSAAVRSNSGIPLPAVPYPSCSPPSADTMSAEAYLAILCRAEALRRAIRGLFSAVDVLVCPTVPITAFYHDPSATIDEALSPKHCVKASNGRISIPYRNLALYASLPCLSGCPALTIPIGRSSENLPIGLMLTAAVGNESLLFDCAGRIGTITSPRVPPPLPEWGDV